MDRYQDYVIKDGKFIGEFEKMYNKFDNPWHQKDIINESYSRWSTIFTLKRLNIRSAVEIGCGLGAFTNMIKEYLSSIDLVGIDISATAIDKAIKSYPGLSFRQGDLLEFSGGGSQNL